MQLTMAAYSDSGSTDGAGPTDGVRGGGCLRPYSAYLATGVLPRQLRAAGKRPRGVRV